MKINLSVEQKRSRCENHGYSPIRGPTLKNDESSRKGEGGVGIKRQPLCRETGAFWMGWSDRREDCVTWDARTSETSNLWEERKGEARSRVAR